MAASRDSIDSARLERDLDYSIAQQKRKAAPSLLSWFAALAVPAPTDTKVLEIIYSVNVCIIVPHQWKNLYADLPIK